jgi:hypothetical protein
MGMDKSVWWFNRSGINVQLSTKENSIMANKLRLSTALTLQFGPFLDPIDGVTPETGLTIAQANVRLSKAGAAFAQKNDATSATHDENGFYRIPLNTTDTNTLGALKIAILMSGAAPIWVTFEVVPVNEFDSTVAGTDVKHVDVTQVTGTGVSDVDDFKADVSGLSTFDESSDSVITDSASRTASQADVSNLDVAVSSRSSHSAADVWTATTRTLTSFGSLVADIASAVWANVTRTLTGIVSANVTQISGDSVAADNLELQYDGSGLTGDTFPATQAQIGNLATGTAATSVKASSIAITTGTEGGDVSDTEEEDGVYNTVTADGGNTDFYYEFDIGPNGAPVSITWRGYAQSQGDSFTIQAYDWVSTSWKTIGTINGAAGTTPLSEEYDLLVGYVGTGANVGLVRYRVLSTDGTLYATDRIFCSFATSYASVGYANGSIWIDTNNGVPGTTPFINGVADNPVNNVTDALVLSGATGLIQFQIVSGSVITLIADATGMVGLGELWTLNLAGQIGTNATVYGALISGLMDVSSTGTSFNRSRFNGCSLTPLFANGCALTDTIILLGTGTYLFDSCFSGIAGSATPTIDFGAVGAKALNMRHYSGGIEIENMKAGDTMSLEGEGQIIFNANCSGGTLSMRGNFSVTDNSGNVTITEDANYNAENAKDVADTALSDYDGPTNAEMEARTLPTANYFDPTSDDVVTDTASRDASKADVSDIPTVAEFEARTLPAAGYFDFTADAVNLGSILGQILTETNSGDFGRSMSFFFDVSPTTTKTVNDVGVAGAGLTAQQVWEYATRVLTVGTKDSEIDAILVDTGTTIPGLIAALNDFNPATESVITDAASRTASQADVSALALDATVAKEATLTARTVLAAVYATLANQTIADGKLDSIQTDLDNPDQYKADVSGLAQDSTVAKETTLIARSITAALYATVANQVIADGKLDGIQADLDNPAQYQADVSALALEVTVQAIQTAVAAVQGDVTDILDYEGGNWTISNDQMIFFRQGGAELARFNLFKSGVPEDEAPDQRVKV